jgi:hypothetical protein
MSEVMANISSSATPMFHTIDSSFAAFASEERSFYLYFGKVMEPSEL